MQPTSVEEYMQGLMKQIRREDFVKFSKKQLQIVGQDTQKAIIDENIDIPRQLGIKELKIKKKTPVKQDNGEEEAEVLKMINSEKQFTKQKLKELQSRELKLKQKLRQFSPRVSQKPISILTQEEKTKIKKALHEKRSFQKELSRKDKQISQEKQRRRQQALKEKQDMIEKRREKNRQQSLKKLQSIELRSLERKKIEQISRELQKNVEQKRYLYEEYEQNDLDLEQQQQKRKEEVMKEIHKRYKLDIEQIREHSRKYDQLIRQNKERIHNKSSMPVNHRMKSYSDNRFSVMVKQMMEAEKMQEYQRLKYANQFKNNIAKYQQHIDHSFKPKISKKSRFVPLGQTSSVKSLTGPARYMKGMQYLQTAKKLKSPSKQKQKKLLETSNNIQRYKNYLLDIEKKNYETDEQKFKQIVKKGRSMSDYESANTAILLAEKIDGKARKNRDEKMFSSVKNKLDILNALQ